MTGFLDIFKLLKWVLSAGFAIAVISLILVFLPDQDLNALGEGLSALAQVISDLPAILLNFILLLVALILILIVVRLGGNK